MLSPCCRFELLLALFGCGACVATPDESAEASAPSRGDAADDGGTGWGFLPPDCVLPSDMKKIAIDGPCAWVNEYCCQHAAECLPCETLTEEECRADKSGFCYLGRGVTDTPVGPKCQFTKCMTASTCVPQGDFFDDFAYVYDPAHPEKCFYVAGVVPVGWVVDTTRTHCAGATEESGLCIGAF